MGMKLVIVEEGQYSDFVYTALVVKSDFDPAEALRSFHAEAQRRYANLAEDRYMIHDIHLAGWLVQKYGARDPSPSEVVVMGDPIHYGSWDGREYEHQLEEWG